MNWIKAKPEVFIEYEKDVTGARVLSDGEAVRHFELDDPLFVLMKDDHRVTFWTHEALLAYIEWTEPTEEL